MKRLAMALLVSGLAITGAIAKPGVLIRLEDARPLYVSISLELSTFDGRKSRKRTLDYAASMSQMCHLRHRSSLTDP